MIEIGAPGGIRTHDQLIKSQLLYQLSYRGNLKTIYIAAKADGKFYRARLWRISSYCSSRRDEAHSKNPKSEIEVSLVTPTPAKFCFRHFRAGVWWTARIFFADADERGFDGEFFFRHGAVGELLRERMVGGRCFAEDENAAGFLVKPVQNCQRRPARLSMFQPVINAFARVRAGCVRVPAGGFVDHQQMLVLEDHARNHAP